MTLLVMMDPLPSGYNRDTQQTKPVLLVAVKEIQRVLPLLEGILTSLEVDEGRMLKVAGINFSVAPDLAVQLTVKGGVSFREAYKVVKLLVGKGWLRGNFEKLTPGLVNKAAVDVLGKSLKVSQLDLDQVKTVRAAALGHTSEGGSAPAEVKKQIEQLNRQLESVEKEIGEKKAAMKRGIKLLQQEVRAVLRGGE